MAERKVDVTIEGKNKASGAFKDAAGDLESFGARMTRLLNPVNLLKGALASLGVIGFGALAKKSVEAAAEAEAAWGRVESAVTNAGISFRLVREDLEKTFATIQQTTRFSDDQAADAFTQLLTISNDYAGSVKNLNLVTDIAAAKKIDLATAAQLVGKAMAGETSTLKRYGIVLSENADAIEELGKRFSGFAERDANTLQGRLLQIANAWDNVLESLGRAITGMDDTGAGTNRLRDGLESLATWIDDNRGNLKELADALATIGAWLLKLGDLAIWQPFKMIVEGYSLLAERAAAPGSVIDMEDAGDGAYLRALGRIRARARKRAEEEAAANQREVEKERKRREEEATRATREREQRERDKLFEKGQEAASDLDMGFLRARSGLTTPGAASPLKPLEDAAPKLEITERISEATVAMQEFGDTVRGIGENTVLGFAQIWGDVLIGIVTGSEKAGAAIGKAFRRATGTALIAEGQKWLLEAGAIAIKGFYNPVDWWRAGRLALQGSLAVAAGGAMAGGGGGAGAGSGLGGGGFQQQQNDMAAGRESGTIVIQGGLLDMSDPRQADALARALSELSGRDVIVMGAGT